jgi:aarF domain-containing kinase
VISTDMNGSYRFVVAATLGAVDYKLTFARSYDSEEARLQAYSQCHTRSAKRVLNSLLANGGSLSQLTFMMSN